MSEFSAKSLRDKMKSKIARLVRTDPKAKVDASGYTPPDALDADVKTGARPLSRRQYRKGGKVVAMHGEHAKKHAGKKPRRAHRAMGGMDGDDMMSNVPAPRAARVNVPMNPRYGAEAVNKAIDSSNRSGRKISRGEAAKIHRLLRGRYKSGGKALTADSYINRDVREANEERDGYKHTGGFKRGGKTMHDDVAEDKKLIKSMVKPGAIRKGKADGGDTGSFGRKSKEKSQVAESAMRMAMRRGVNPYDTEPDQGKAYKTLWKLRQGRPEHKHGGEIHAASCRCAKCSGGSMGRAEGGKNWIKGAIKHPGSLHKALHVPKGEKIPAKKLEKAAHSDKPGLAKKANLAKTLKGFHKKADGGYFDPNNPRGLPVPGATQAPPPKPVPAPPVRRGPPEDYLNDMRAARAAAAAKNMPFRKHGGKTSVSDGELEGTRPTGGRKARKDGGRTSKGKMNVNIIIGTGGADKPGAAPAGMVPPLGMRPPVGLPVPVPAAGAPAAAGLGAAPAMPPAPPVPPAAPMGAGAMPGLPGRKAGGRVGHRSYKSVKDFDAGSGSGLGRLEKVKVYGHKA